MPPPNTKRSAGHKRLTAPTSQDFLAYADNFAYAILHTHALFSTDANGSAAAFRLAHAEAGADALSVAYVLEITRIYRIRLLV
jgi:hypothetical protein